MKKINIKKLYFFGQVSFAIIFWICSTNIALAVAGCDAFSGADQTSCNLKYTTYMNGGNVGCDYLGLWCEAARAENERKAVSETQQIVDMRKDTTVQPTAAGCNAITNSANKTSCNEQYALCMKSCWIGSCSCEATAVASTQQLANTAAQQAQPTAPATQCTAGTAGCSITYVPLEPLPTALGGSGTMGTGLAGFLNYLFPILITLGAMIGVLTFTYWGVEYMITESTSGKGTARAYLMSVLYGLLLLVSSVLILKTINPALVKFDLSSLVADQGMAAQNTTAITSTNQSVTTNQAPKAVTQ